MAKQTVKSNLAAKLGSGLQKALYDHRGDETKFSNDLPPGIENGVAQLVECKFATYQSGDLAGQYYFQARGVVVKPTHLEGIKVAGLHTQIQEPLCDTPNRSRKTVGDHLAWILNEMRKLGFDTTSLEPDGLESAAAALKQAKPHFRFRTWKGTATKEFPNPRTNHEWNGVTTLDTEENDPAAGVEESGDNSEGESLGARADNGDEDAQIELSNMAAQCDLDPDDYDSWVEVAEAIETARNSGDEDESSDEDEEEPSDEDESDDEDEETPADDWKPEKSEVYKYKPPKSKKLVECEVKAVFESKETVNLKNLDDGKTLYKSVPWSELVREEE